MTDPRLITAVEGLIEDAERPGHVPLIGISGAQGSGKTTLAGAAAGALGCARLSLDDVYRTRAERERMAREVHLLFGTRGPPGTHDLDLLTETVAALRAAGPDQTTALPAFDKLADDRKPRSQWPGFQGRPRAVLVDGWLVGATPQVQGALAAPINALERAEDADGVWRREANARLAGGQAVLNAAFDAILFLQAPAFEVVLDWRWEQEAGLRRVEPSALGEDERARLARFIAHFERITRHMLEGGVRADTVVRLDRDRRVVGMDTNDEPGR